MIPTALTEKQRQFAEEYLIDLNATQAAIRAGYSRKNAMRIGYQLLQKPQVQSAVRAAMGAREERTHITQDWVLEELYRVASANGADFAQVVTVGTDGIDGAAARADDGPRVQHVALTDTEELPPEKRAAIAGVKQTKFGIEVSTYDKVRALELLGKHLGLFTDRLSVEGAVPVVITGGEQLED